MACEGDRFVTIFCHDCGVLRQVQISCGDRTCPTCREREFFRLKKKYGPAMAVLDSKKLVFITLTRRIDGMSLRDKVIETKKAWQALIRLKGMEAITGGFYTIEVKYSEKWHGWNVHIHSVCEVHKKARVRIWKDRVSRRLKADVVFRAGQHVSIQWLRREWKRLTGDSDRVDVAPVLDTKGGVKGVMSYILKYLNKPVEVAGKVWEYNQALKGLRMVNAWGAWYPNSKNYRFVGIDLSKEPMKCDCGHTVWISEFEMVKLLRRYRNGELLDITESLSPPPPWFVQGFLNFG